MLRSLDYAAHTGVEQYLSAYPDTTEESLHQLEGWAVFWQRSSAIAFLRSYRRAIASRPELLPNGDELHTLLRGYLLEKALYELLYELNNRPAWARIPLAGILSLSM